VPPATLEAPEPSPPALRLPPPSPAAAAAPPAGLDLPLASESEGFALLAGVARELARELPGARARTLRFEDGTSELALVASSGTAVRARSRSCSLWVEAAKGTTRVAAEFVARSAAELKPLGVARRLVDRLRALDAPPGAALDAMRDAMGDATSEGVRAATREGELVLAPPLAARLLEALAPRLCGADARAALAGWQDAEGRLAARAVSIVDDLGDVRGVLAAPYDGEGLPSRAVRLIDAGRLLTPLVAWWEGDAREASHGLALRPGWRDLPRPGPTQLYIEPDPAAGVGELVGAIGRGAYLLAAEGGVRIAADGVGFTVPVSGFALADGRATGGLGACQLVGRLDRWLAGISAVGRDLVFVPGSALFGSPTLVVSGLELAPLADGGAVVRPESEA
jgi:predicted Zn-dependent protease